MVVLVTAILVSILPGYPNPRLEENIRGFVAPGWEKVEAVFRSDINSMTSSTVQSIQIEFRQTCVCS